MNIFQIQFRVREKFFVWIALTFFCGITPFPHCSAQVSTELQDWRTFGQLNANQLGIIVYNYGCFGHETKTPSFEWPMNSKIHYGNQFGLIVGGEVDTRSDETNKLITHSLDLEEASEKNEKWWQPLPGYCADYNQLTSAERQEGYLAFKNKPKTWGTNFPKNEYGELLWPGQFGPGQSVADQEFYYKMDDRYNQLNIAGSQSHFYPDTSNFNFRGLGIEVTARGYQFVARVAEDMAFLLFELKNVGTYTLPKLVVGLFGDPQIGGREDAEGDFFQFNPDSNFVYFWDEKSIDLTPALPPVGFLGVAFLETPGNASDGLDNDHDGWLDESQSNGEDDDQDWQATDSEAAADTNDFDGQSDDVGSDGIPETGDDGENNGQPDLGEPDFEITDLDEVDLLNITSFSAIQIAGIAINNRRKTWDKMNPGTFETEQDVDLGLLMGSGYFALTPAEIQKLSVLILAGKSAPDLIDKIAIAHKMYYYNFNFLKAPNIPIVQAEAGDRRVTLTWDNHAEQSFDPILGYDFEGYAIYRSTDGIQWGKPITNSRGERIFDAPIARFDDSTRHFNGYHPVDVEGVHFYLGDDTGLSHSFVDSNLINGVTYYYAVTAYDFGSERYRMAPLECSKNIGNSNVVAVTPRSNAASNLENIYVVPNPYIASSIFDQSASGVLGGRKVVFRNLPSNSTIRIFTITGELVRLLEHQNSGGDESWDLLNEDGLEVASGTYIFHVEAAGLGNTIGRVAIIK